MRNIKAVVQYDGSRYYGFQAQLDPENLPTVQEELEEMCIRDRRSAATCS